MRRRDVLAIIGGTSIYRPFCVNAQQKLMPVVGYLSPGSPQRGLNPVFPAFMDGLGDTGYVEGKNVVLEFRAAGGNPGRPPELAADLVSRKVDVIMAAGGIASALAAKGATSTIPVVFTVGTDPVAANLVTSLARPGGNLTGVSALLVDLTPKRLEMLSELVPHARVIAF
jgi:putative ABC transport system substrate-binding protein